MARLNLVGALEGLETREGPRGGATITFTDLGITKIEKNLQRLLKLRLVVGSVGTRAKETYDSGITVGTVAVIMEFGAEFIPARPFMARALREGKTELERIIEVQMGEVALGNKTAEDALSVVGETMARMVVKAIRQASAWATPLAESTVNAKGSSKPLIDDGLLLESIGYEVRDGERVIRSSYVT